MEVNIDDFDKINVKDQLKQIYTKLNLVVIILLFSLLTIGAILISLLSSRSTRHVLLDQIANNSSHILNEVGDVLYSTLSVGTNSLILPAAYGLRDSFSQQPNNSLATPSYAMHPDNSLATPVTATDPGVQDRFKGQTFSLTASSVYMHGFDGSNESALMNSHQDAVQASSQMDHQVKSSWVESEEWIDVQAVIQEGKILRQYPGASQCPSAQLCNRDQDPTQEPSQVETIGAEVVTKEFQYDVIYHDINQSELGRGYNLQITIPLSKQDDSLVGIVGANLYLPSFEDFIATIKFRESGTVNLYHSQSQNVISSPKWDQTGEIPKIWDISIDNNQTKFESIKNELTSIEKNGTLFTNDQMIVLNKVAKLKNVYELVAVTPINEILKPYEDKKWIFLNYPLILIGIILILCLIMQFVNILFIDLIAEKISTPLLNLSNEFNKFINNIGGDLFKDIQLSNTYSNLKEISQLGFSFRKLIRELKSKKDETKQLIPNKLQGNEQFNVECELTDIYNKNASTSNNQNDKNQDNNNEIDQNIEEELNDSDQQFSIKDYINWGINFPIIVFIILIICLQTYYLVSFFGQLDEIKNVMINEELKTLEIRTLERSQDVKQIFNSHINAVRTLKNYTENIANETYTIQNTISSQFTPADHCLNDSAQTGFNCDLQTLNSNPHRPGSGPLTNTEFSTWFRNGHIIADNSPIDADFKQNTIKTSLDKFSQLDNIFRAVQFSNNLNFAQVGFENEIMMNQPYISLENFPNFDIDCDEITEGRQTNKSIGFTPVCRPWQHNAWKQSADDIVLNPIDIDAITGNLQISISSKINQAGNPIGVVSVDIDIADLQSKIVENTNVQDNGYAFIVHKNGDVIIHPNKVKNDMTIRHIADVEATGNNSQDENTQDEWQGKILSQMQQNSSGSQVYNKFNSRWVVFWKVVQGTDQILCITVAYNDINSAINASITQITWTIFFPTLIIIIIAIIFVGRLMCQQNNWQQDKLILPIELMSEQLDEGFNINWTEDFQFNIQTATSQEVITIGNGFIDVIETLRFGNSAYQKGDPQIEEKNILNILKIVEQSNNQRGLSICKNNLANIQIRIKFEGIGIKDNEKINKEQILNKINESIDHCNKISILSINEIKEMIASRKINTLYNYLVFDDKINVDKSIKESLDQINKDSKSINNISTFLNLIQFFQFNDGNNLTKKEKQSILNQYDKDQIIENVIKILPNIQQDNEKNLLNISLNLTKLTNDPKQIICALQYTLKIDRRFINKFNQLIKKYNVEMDDFQEKFSNENKLKIKQIIENFQNDYRYKHNFNIIQMLDESGSMAGQRWNSITNQTEESIEKIRPMVSPQSRLEIIFFDHDVRSVYNTKFSNQDKNELKKVFKLQKSGGTNFGGPFINSIESIKRNVSQHQHLCFFFTDGDAPYPDYATSQYKQIIHKMGNVQLYLLNEDDESPILKRIEKEIGYKNCKNEAIKIEDFGDKVIDMFESIGVSESL